MQDNTRTPPNRIEELRRQRGLTLAALARRAGTSAQQMGRLEAGSRRLTQGWMLKIAAALGVTSADLLPDAGRASDLQADQNLPAAIGFDLPVLGSSRSSTGSMVLTPTPVELVRRPSPLIGVMQGFAFRVIDDQMEPAYRPGDLVFARTGLEPLAGQDVLLLGAPGPEGATAAVLARLVSIGGEELILRQFGSSNAWQESRSRWPRVAIVVGCYRRL